jgi:predicted dinucleotide-binding enzyme
MNCDVMVNPQMVGDIDMLLCGNDTNAKEKVKTILKEFGWKSILDLGTLDASRTMEAYVLLWVRVMMNFNSPHFGVKFVKK